MDAIVPTGLDASSQSQSRKVLRVTTLVCLLAIVVFAHPVAAQESTSTNPICQDSSGTLADVIEGFVQITTALGLMGLLVVWQIDSLAEMFTLGHEQKSTIKRHKHGAMKSAGTLVVLGPLFSVAGSVMDLPIAQCVDLVPF